MTSDSGDRVKWCLGVENKRTVAKISNNTRTYMEIIYPDRWKVVDGMSLSLSTDTVARAVGMTLPNPRGTASRIVDGGDTLTLAIPDGASGKISTEISLVAWTVTAFVLAGEVYSGVAGAANSALGVAAKGKADRLATLLGAETEVSQFEALKECTWAASDETEMSSSAAVDAFKVAVKCVPAIMKNQLEDVEVFAAGTILAMVGTAISLIATAANLLVTAIREFYDELASLGGKSDAFYDIFIRRPAEAVLPAVAGTVFVGTAVLKIMLATGKKLVPTPITYGCEQVSVLGADPSTTSADLLVVTSLCDGDPVSTWFRIRDGKVSSTGWAAYDAGVGDVKGLDKFLKPYAGRRATAFMISPADDTFELLVP